jgi:hypothetical protein
MSPDGVLIMVMPLSGTFAYSTTVPVGAQDAFPWKMKSLESFRPSGDPLHDKRLVGWSPLLYVREAGLPPNPGPSVHSVERSEIRLVATDKKDASLETASYFVDRVLFRALRPGDVFHIARTGCGGVGVSAVREGKLVFAVGAVGAVPLGSGISVKTPYDLLKKAEAILRNRDPEFEFLHQPIEICIGNHSRILFRGHVEMGGYQVRVEHGFLAGIPGTAESVSITLNEACNWVAGSASAQLLALPKSSQGRDNSW